MRSRLRDRARSASRVPIFVLAPRAPAVSPRLPFSPAEEAGLTRVADLVTRSGGYLPSATTKKEMVTAVSELVKMVASPYRLSFEGRPVGNDLQIQVSGRRRVRSCIAESACYRGSKARTA